MEIVESELHIAQEAKEAAEHHMSYGKYIEMLENQNKHGG